MNKVNKIKENTIEKLNIRFIDEKLVQVLDDFYYIIMDLCIIKLNSISKKRKEQ